MTILYWSRDDCVEPRQCHGGKYS